MDKKHNISCFESEEAAEILKDWRTEGVCDHGLLIAYPPGDWNGCMDYVEMLARAYHATHRIPATFERSFLALEYLNTADKDAQNRFFESPVITAEFSNRFMGVFAIEISQWKNEFFSPGFMRLVNYAAENQTDARFVFLLETVNKDTVAAAYKCLGEKVRLGKVEMSYLPAKDYVAYVTHRLAANGVEVGQEARRKLASAVGRMVERKSFGGFSTVDRLVEEVSYRKQEKAGVGLDAYDIELSFTELERMMEANERKMGF